MSIAVGSASRLLRVAESAWGTTPATPTGIFTRYTGMTINPIRDAFESKEIRSDRQTADMRLGILMAAGDIDVELSSGAFDDLLESLMFSTWASDVLKIGSTRKSFTLEAGHTGINQFLSYPGSVVDKFQVSFKPGEIVTGKFSIKAKTAARAGTSLFATTSAAPTDSPFDTFSGAFLEGGSPIASVTSADFTIDNQLEEAKVCGNAGLYDIQPQRAKIDGNLVAYFESGAMLDKFLNETASSLSLQAAGGSKSITFALANLKYRAGKTDTTKEGLLMVEMPFSGLMHATDTALKITRDLT